MQALASNPASGTMTMIMIMVTTTKRGGGIIVIKQWSNKYDDDACARTMEEVNETPPHRSKEIVSLAVTGWLVFEDI